MKKILLVSGVLLSVAVCSSQNIDEAKNHIYYERFETAKTDLLSVIAQPEPSPDAWYWLGEIYLRQKQVDSAKQILTEGMDYFTKHDLSFKEYPLLQVGWAHLLLDSGKTEEARTVLEDILKKGKFKNTAALLAGARANIDSKNGNAAWAIELLNKAVKRDHKNAPLFVALGDAYKKQFDGSNAIRNYNKALEINPSLAEAMYKKGIIYLTQNNIEVYLDRFKNAWELDSTYAPVSFELYYYYYTRDVIQAEKYLNAYIANADPSPKNAYMRTDQFYLSRKYDEAILGAEQIIKTEGIGAQPRLYKLMAYSYAALKDSTSALRNMDLYFDKQDTGFVAKDYSFKAALLTGIEYRNAETIELYKKAFAAEKDSTEKLSYMVKLAVLQHDAGNLQKEALWRERIYYTKKDPNNIDVYDWGVALFSAGNYEKADSVFSIYEEKYPTQVYGYLWRAKSNALLDTSMTAGLAIPHYKKLIAIASEDTSKFKAILVRAYNYLGVYEANVTRDFSTSLQYFKSIIQLDPDNEDAINYSETLQKWLNKNKN